MLILAVMRSSDHLWSVVSYERGAPLNVPGNFYSYAWNENFGGLPHLESPVLAEFPVNE